MVDSPEVGSAIVENRDDEEILEPMQFDDNLPPGWGRRCVQRAAGVSAGKWDVYLISPDGRKFKSRGQLQSYFDRKNITDYTAEDFDFTVRGRTNFGLRVKRQAASLKKAIMNVKKKIVKKGKRPIKGKLVETKKSTSKVTTAVTSSKLVVKMNFKQTRSRKQLKRKKPIMPVKKTKKKSENLKDEEIPEASPEPVEPVEEEEEEEEDDVEDKHEVNVFHPVELKSSPRKRKLSIKLLESESVSKKMINAATNSIIKKSPKIKRIENVVPVSSEEIIPSPPRVVVLESSVSKNVSSVLKKGPKIKVIKVPPHPHKNAILPVQTEPKKRGRKKGSKNKVKRAPNTLKTNTKKQKISELSMKQSQSEMIAYSFPQASMHDRQLSNSYVTGIHDKTQRTILRGPTGSKVETDIINGQKVTYVTIMPPKGSGEYLVLDSGHTYAKKPRYIISRTPVSGSTTVTATTSASQSRVIVTSLPSSKPMLSCIKPIQVGPVVDVAAYETV